ncbi:type IV toxin-antitoxin system AbiEi family antitoxin domain-containing protein [Steroidobacter sp.]|uniref:type IV toxin-antitoxin system AbiEi family antitoxin domain-containing protein n=1 Tax=Steroidobacter sp. TaxID=1978227 RepID=UPI001A476BE2|nr:type IV toxin-antitoxin system AbiEi family antitoxin domain-containing protein [Steroidobacter sp.]MBL8266167.1 hypothetical protein [Steroidobacter sp.]
MRQTLENRLQQRIARKRSDVFLRSDFDDLAGYDQIGRALRRFVDEGKLLKVSQGVYTRVVQSPFGDRLIPPKGIDTLKEALARLGIETSLTRLEQDYNAGRTTQVPAGRRVAVNKRVRRKIGYSGISLSFERARPSSG